MKRPSPINSLTMKNHPENIRLFAAIVLCSLCFFPLHAQYLENFTGQNGKGLIDAACTDADLSTCTPAADLSGVNWTITGNFSGFDPSSPDDFGVINEVFTASDTDNEVCWNSPTLYLSTAGVVSLSVDLSEDNTDLESDDYIDVEYRVNGGDFVTVTTAFSSGGHSIVGDLPDAGDFGNTVVTASGISGDSLHIRVCVDQNGASERLLIDNITVPEAGVSLSPPVNGVSDRTHIGVSVFPNPVSDRIIFETLAEAEAGRFQLVSATGIPVRSGYFQNYRHLIHTETLSSGFYTLIIYADSGIGAQKIQILR